MLLIRIKIRKILYSNKGLSSWGKKGTAVVDWKLICSLVASQVVGNNPSMYYGINTLLGNGFKNILINPNLFEATSILQAL